MAVSTEAGDALATEIRQVRDQVRAAAEQKALQNLKKPLRKMELLLQPEEASEGGDNGKA
jgi:hypothetical protein